ncbi:unnamed protein product, partial [Rotaria magnacalcarata]
SLPGLVHSIERRLL